MNKYKIISSCCILLSMSMLSLADDTDTFISAAKNAMTQPDQCNPDLYKQAMQFQQDSQCAKSTAKTDPESIDKASQCEASIAYVLNACSRTKAPSSLSNPMGSSVVPFPNQTNKLPARTPAQTPPQQTAEQTSQLAPATQPLMNNSSNQMVNPPTASNTIQPFSYSASNSKTQPR